MAVYVWFCGCREDGKGVYPDWQTAYAAGMREHLAPAIAAALADPRPELGADPTAGVLDPAGSVATQEGGGR